MLSQSCLFKMSVLAPLRYNLSKAYLLNAALVFQRRSELYKISLNSPKRNKKIQIMQAGEILGCAIWYKNAIKMPRQNFIGEI